MQPIRIIQGRVMPGKRLGRSLGFPTANLNVAPTICEGNQGVWFGRVIVGGAKYWALVNIGVRPTVASDGSCKVEAWLMDFEGDLYDREMTVELVKYLRPEKRFGSVEQLRQAMEQDRKDAQKIIHTNEYRL